MNCPSHNVEDKSEAARRRLSSLTMIAVVVLYGWIAIVHVWEPGANSPARQPYNLQAAGFLAGQLNLLEPTPTGLSELSDPYDPNSNSAYRAPRNDGSRLHDLSYHNGKLYLYFGVTPILVLFGPWLLITGSYFPQELAVLVFCGAGFLAGAWLYCQVAQRFFPQVPDSIVAAGLLAFGLASGLPPLLLRPEIYEVPISCGYAFVMLALTMVWRALANEGRRTHWLALASLCYGLAVAARPSLLFGAAILLAPVIAYWRAQTEADQRMDRTLRLLAAAVLPIAMVGIGLLWFNSVRFGSPLEFGQKFQLAGINVRQNPPLFSIDFIPYNLRVYFLQPVLWTADSVFPKGISTPIPPANHLGTENPYGVLTSMPFAWLAGLGVLMWRRRWSSRDHRLSWIVGCVLALFVAGAITLSAFAGACGRYQAEFLPALMMLAAIGLLVLERMLFDYPTWRAMARWIWGLGLLYSAAVGLQVGASAVSPYHLMRSRDMWALLKNGHTEEPLAKFESAVRRFPIQAQPYSERGYAYSVVGRFDDAMKDFKRALEIDPQHIHAHNGMGELLMAQGRTAEARRYFLRSLELRPNNRIAVEKLALLNDKGAVQVQPE